MRGVCLGSSKPDQEAVDNNVFGRGEGGGEEQTGRWASNYSAEFQNFIKGLGKSGQLSMRKARRFSIHFDTFPLLLQLGDPYNAF